MIDWKPISDGLPPVRAPLLMVDAGLQEAQVGWWDGFRFCRWAGGGVEPAMPDPTHYSLIGWPASDDPLSTWEESFRVWEKGGRSPAPDRLYHSDKDTAERALAKIERELDSAAAELLKKVGYVDTAMAVLRIREATRDLAVIRAVLRLPEKPKGEVRS